MAKALWKISLRQISAHAHVGIHDEEQLTRNELLIDADVWFTMDVKKDEIAETIDYKLIYDLILAESAVKTKLLETMAMRIVKSIFKNMKAVKKIRLRLAKQNPKYLPHVKEAVLELETARP